MNAPANAPAAPLPSSDPAPDITIERMRIDDILGLRKLALGHSSDAPARFDGDADPTTWHIGLTGPYDRNAPARLIACVTYVFEPYNGPYGKELAWRMRGLAALHSPAVPSTRAQLLAVSERMVIDDSRVPTLWSYAHILDRQLLEQLGWAPAMPRPIHCAEGIRFLMVKRPQPFVARN